MVPPSTCTHSRVRKHGRDRKGNQRFRCSSCLKTFTEPRCRPIGTHRIDEGKAEAIIGALMEGNSIRSVQGIRTEVIECDEVWSWAGCKEKTRERKGYGEDMGDVWFHTAIDPETKLLVCWHAGRREAEDTREFCYKLADAVSGYVQISTDGLSNYRIGLPMAFGMRVHHAAVIKQYAGGNEDYKYSPSRISGVEKYSRWGNPDLERASTSIIERSNLTIRTNLRRFTRLTIAFSKSRRHHQAMFAIWAVWYNSVKPHLSLKNATPAMAHGLSDSRWSIHRMLREVATHS